MSAVLLIAIPLLAAFISILFKKYSIYLLFAVTIFNIANVFLATEGIVIIGGFSPPLGISLLVDTYSKIALLLVNALVLVIAALNVKAYPKYGTILLLVVAGLNGLVLTNDLFNFFVFLEISGIAAYLITASNKKPISTFRYLVIGAIGSSLFLLGLIILYSMFGTLNMVDMIKEIALNNNYQELVLPFTLMFIGLGVEAKLLPFNSWVKGILGHSNTFSGPMIASVYASAMGFVLGRFITNLFNFEGMLLTVVLVILVAGIVLSDIMAFASKKSREILLFSSVAQASMIALLFVNGIIIWAVYLIIANALSKTVMFMIINKAQKDVGSDEVKSLQGLFANNLVIGIIFTIATLSVMGLPLLVGFTIKLNFLTELADAGQIWTIAFILVASVVEGIYFVKLLLKLWYPEGNLIKVDYHLSFKLVFAVIALALLTFGVYQAPLDKLDDTVDTV
ncbi:MAG: NADH-ubiquinone oxidoreductase, partial [Tenericutes bacterium HGW-Tenericutes-7]